MNIQIWSISCFKIRSKGDKHVITWLRNVYFSPRPMNRIHFGKFSRNNFSSLFTLHSSLVTKWLSAHAPRLNSLPLSITPLQLHIDSYSRNDSNQDSDSQKCEKYFLHTPKCIGCTLKSMTGFCNLDFPLTSLLAFLHWRDSICTSLYLFNS